VAPSARPRGRRAAAPPCSGRQPRVHRRHGGDEGRPTA